MRVFGLLTIKGADAPLGTVATLAFDGIPGPSEASTQKGGYAVEFRSSNETCANRVGAALSVIINGQSFATGRIVGSTEAFVRFDIAIP